MSYLGYYNPVYVLVVSTLRSIIHFIIVLCVLFQSMFSWSALYTNTKYINNTNTVNEQFHLCVFALLLLRAEFLMFLKAVHRHFSRSLAILNHHQIGFPCVACRHKLNYYVLTCCKTPINQCALFLEIIAVIWVQLIKTLISINFMLICAFSVVSLLPFSSIRTGRGCSVVSVTVIKYPYSIL